MRSDQYFRISVSPSAWHLDFAVNISYSNSNWQYIQINFVATTRNDMELGLFQADIRQYSSVDTFRATLTKGINNSVVVALLSGF